MNMKEISEAIYNSDDKAKKNELDKVYYKMTDYLKEHDRSGYQNFKEKAEDILYQIDEQQARRIVDSMRPYGQRWNLEEIDAYLKKKDINDKSICYYLAMNMAYNDYSRTAKLHKVDEPEFYFNMAYDFINDQDGKRHKVYKYFMD